MKSTDLPIYSRLAALGYVTIRNLTRAIEENELVLPADSIKELKHAGLLK